MYFGGRTIVRPMRPRTPQKMVFLRDKPSSRRPETALNAHPTENHCSERKQSYPQTKCSCLKHRKRIMKLIQLHSLYHIFN